MKFSTRAERIEPFYVMEVAKAAQALAREVAGTREPMIFLNIGEPDFTAPPLVQEAAARAVHNGATQYTNALGLEPLREAISQYVEREELRETFHRDTLEAWQEFQETGQYATAQDVDQWLASWGTDAEGAPPACHQ